MNLISGSVNLKVLYDSGYSVPARRRQRLSSLTLTFRAPLFADCLLQELYLENNLIEEISEAVFNQTENLNVVSLSHNRLDETRIAPMAWINHRSEPSVVAITTHI